MKLFYHRTVRGNVGDDLNAVLWPRMLPQFDDIRPDDWLIGIGTIIDHRLKALPGRKVILGAGFRPGAKFIGRGPDFEFLGVRGTLSARSLGLARAQVACDPAFLAARWPEYAARPGGSVALIPHLHTEDWSNLSNAVREAGLEVISPAQPVTTFLQQLGRCSRVFTEALHGAILADALRVPWARVRLGADFHEGDGVSEYKWRDAFSLLGVDVRPVNQLSLIPARRSWPGMRRFMNPVQTVFERRVARELAAMRDDDAKFRLSPVEKLDERLDDLMTRIERIEPTDAVRWPEVAMATREEVIS